MPDRSSEIEDDPNLPGLVRHDAGILFAPIEDPRELPETVHLNGTVYRRFMDRILIPSVTDALEPPEIIAVNRLRLDLIEGGHPMGPNRALKMAIGEVIHAAQARKVIEWGPGKDPIVDYCDLDAYVGVDLDESARTDLTDRGLRCFAATDPRLLETGPADLIVAVFVFHFHISPEEIGLMRRLLGDTGAIVANVYRRGRDSRRALAAAFAAEGLLCAARQDRSEACRDQELWVVSPEDPDPLLDVFEAAYLDAITRSP